MPLSTIKYTKEELTIVWKPNQCAHSRICWSELKAVFDPSKRPWVNMEGASKEKIIEQVLKCPSGALHFIMNEEIKQENKDANMMSDPIQNTNILIKPNGPILITTDCQITHSNGDREIKQGTTALCRCGASGNKPYCDGTHNKINFRG